MGACLVSDVVKWSNVTSPLPQKLLFLIGRTCRIPGRVLFDEVCGRSWGSSSVYTLYCNPAGNGHIQITQRNDQHSGDLSFVCVHFLWYEHVHDTHWTYSERSGLLLDNMFCTYRTRYSIPSPIPMTLQVFRDLPRTGDVFPAIRHPSHANIRGNMTHTVERTVSTLELDDRSCRSLVSRLFYRRFPHF